MLNGVSSFNEKARMKGDPKHNRRPEFQSRNSNLGHICTANIQSVDSIPSLEPVFSCDRWKCSVALNEPYGLAGVCQQSVIFCTIDLD